MEDGIVGVSSVLYFAGALRFTNFPVNRHSRPRLREDRLRRESITIVTLNFLMDSRLRGNDGIRVMEQQ